MVLRTTANNWISDDLSLNELTPYFGPSDKELKRQEQFLEY